MDKNPESAKETPAPNQKQPQQQKQSLTHSEMMESLLSTLSTKNPNISVVKSQQNGRSSENTTDVTFLRKLPKE